MSEFTPDRRQRPRDSLHRVGCDGGGYMPERRPERHSLPLPCAIEVIGDGRHEAVLEDISYRGFKLSCASNILVGSQVEIDLGRLGRFPAKVKWALGGQQGGNFLTNVPHETIEQLVSPQRPDPA